MRCGLALAALFFGVAQAEWVAPDGPPEFQVNTTAANDQRIPVVAADAAGNSLIVWQSRNQEEQGWGVYAQRIAADGELAGREFRINAFNTGNQEGQHVQMQGDGRFVVVWHGPDRSSAPDATLIQKREFDSNGQPLSADIRVGDEAGTLQILPRLGWGPDGQRVVVWDSQGVVDDSFNVLGRRFAADGQPATPVGVVNQFTDSAQRRAEVAMAAGGFHVVAWQSANQDGSDWGIFARCKALNGEDGDEFLVNQTTLGAQARPRMAMSDDGRFAIAWQDNRGLSSFQYQRVMVRLYDADCQPLGGEIQVNELDQGIQDLPDISVDPAGRYIVVWQSFPSDFDDQGIYGRWLDPAGEFLGGSFRISEEIEAYQDYPAVQALPDGGLMASWETLGQDGSGFGIYARRLFAPQFIVPIEPLPVPAIGRWPALLLILALALLAGRRLC